MHAKVKGGKSATSPHFHIDAAERSRRLLQGASAQTHNDQGRVSHYHLCDCENSILIYMNCLIDGRHLSYCEVSSSPLRLYGPDQCNIRVENEHLGPVSRGSTSNPTTGAVPWPMGDNSSSIGLSQYGLGLMYCFQSQRRSFRTRNRQHIVVSPSLAVFPSSHHALA